MFMRAGHCYRVQLLTHAAKDCVLERAQRAEETPRLG